MKLERNFSNEKLMKIDWDLRDKSRRPKIIHKKITDEMKSKIISIRNKTGFGAEKIENFVDLSHTSINKILHENKLTEPTKRKKKRIKYIRFQRKHPNSLWQIDHSQQKIQDKWVISVVDDCSRKSLAFAVTNVVTTDIVIHILDELVNIQSLIENLRREALSISEEQFIVQQLKEKSKGCFKLSKENSSFAMEMLNFGG